MARKAYKTVDEYFADLSPHSREIMQKVREAIRQAAPQAEEVISYNIPAFRQDGILVSYAAFKEHIGFYPTPSGIDAFQDELSKYKGAKGSVQFPTETGPMPLLLIKKIVKYRVAENKAAATAKLGQPKKAKKK